MKKGSELGLTPIKCVNKQGTEDIKSIHRGVNDALFYYTKRYISPLVANTLIKDFTEAGVALNQVKDDYQPAKPKAEEIMDKLREMIISLKHYVKSFKWSQEDAKQIQATINYWVRMTVDRKKKGTMDDSIVNLLAEQEEIFTGMVKASNLDGIETKAFLDFNEELFTKFERKYRLS